MSFARKLFSGFRSRLYATPFLGKLRRTSKFYATPALPSYLTLAPKTKISTLGNNIRVATEDIGSEVATVGVWIDAGSVFEDDKNNGTAHFLEHMAFKGTNKRTQHQLEEEVENLGATLNAYTSREQTVYVARSFKKDVPAMIDILSDILQNSTLSKTNIERERSVILKEKEVVEQNMEEVIFDYLHDISFQGTPLQRTILGTEENIKSIQREDLVNYIQTHYTGDRMVIAAAGGVQHDEICRLAEKAFAGIKPKSSFEFRSLGQFPFTGSSVYIRDDLMKEAHIAIAFKGVSWEHPDYFAFLILQSLVGSWDKNLGAGKNLSSRLAEILAVEDLASSLSSFNTCYNSTGLFGAYFVTDQKQVADCTYEVMNEWQRIGKQGLAKEELAIAKTKVKSALLMQLDGSSNIAEDIGRNLIALGRRIEPVELFQRIDAITEADIARIQDEYLYDTDPAVAAIGPLENMPDYNQIRGWTYWNRL